jgi:hypothetical protein
MNFVMGIYGIKKWVCGWIIVSRARHTGNGTETTQEVDPTLKNEVRFSSSMRSNITLIPWLCSGEIAIRFL